VRELTEEERGRLEVGLRSSDAFVVRRCQLLLARDRGEWAPRIAEMLGCNDQMVPTVVKRFGREGLEACLTRRSRRARTAHANVDEVGRGVRVIACYLPITRRWHNATEATGAHGKRRVIEADGLLTIHQLADRASDAFGCSREPQPAFPEKAARLCPR
jgi:hypothetical protein